MKVRFLKFAFALAMAGAVLTAPPMKTRAAEDDAAGQAPGQPAEGDGASQSASESGSASRGGARGRRRERVPPAVARVPDAGIRDAITYPKYPHDGADYAEIDTLKPGANVRFLKAPAMKLKTEKSLKFGDKIVKTGNVSPKFAGVYSVWVKKTADGWSLVFNNDSDIWGTMRDPAADAVEIPLTHEKLETDAPILTVKMEKKEAANELAISWGAHKWTTAFTVEP